MIGCCLGQCGAEKGAKVLAKSRTEGMRDGVGYGRAARGSRGQGGAGGRAVNAVKATLFHIPGHFALACAFLLPTPLQPNSPKGKAVTASALAVGRGGVGWGGGQRWACAQRWPAQRPLQHRHPPCMGSAWEHQAPGQAHHRQAIGSCEFTMKVASSQRARLQATQQSRASSRPETPSGPLTFHNKA